MAKIGYENLFVESEFAARIIECLKRSNCLNKKGDWNGISGNKLEIVAALDALENLNLLMPGKQTTIAKAFCSKFGIEIGKDISMKSFYLTPPLKDYYRFREIFKLGLQEEIEKGEQEELERKKVQRLEHSYRNLVSLSTKAILNYQSLLVKNLLNNEQIKTMVEFLNNAQQWDQNFPDIPSLYILPLPDKQQIMLKETHLDEKLGTHQLASEYYIIDAVGRLRVADDTQKLQPEKFVPIKVSHFLAEFS